MERLSFSIAIDAPREIVWDVLWNDVTYREWTSVFSEGSHAKTDWQEGSKVLFLDGQGSGMVSTILVNRPNEFLSIKHLGEVNNGVEDLDSEKVQSWAGALENYTLNERDGSTELIVDTDITDDFKDYFLKAWPKALDKLTSIVERRKAEVQR